MFASISVTTGISPAVSASRRETEVPSANEVETYTVASDIKRAISAFGTQPIKLILSPTFNDCASCFKYSSCEPVPKITNCASGTFSSTRGTARIRVSTSYKGSNDLVEITVFTFPFFSTSKKASSTPSGITSAPSNLFFCFMFSETTVVFFESIVAIPNKIFIPGLSAILRSMP